MRPDEDEPLSEEEKLELDRRLANYEANPERVIPWETVKAEVERRLLRDGRQ